VVRATATVATLLEAEQFLPPVSGVLDILYV